MIFIIAFIISITANLFLYNQSRQLGEENAVLRNVIMDYDKLVTEKEHEITKVYTKFNRIMRYAFGYIHGNISLDLFKKRIRK